ncbi:SGNH/GDSL hydrolase family protein [Streptomyces mobaraensis NBRC 13819 = DSM 40847]|uniref:SGNH/GDSL hydrolase family protein n=2 Tax=Streptomyces mobaraensis TaxID=35621 RepID=A0A5N5WDU2_STRMB|nr:SGNH/GDSL hydrolase family protein [Streptomyces mobaraensis]EME97336.1 G-D-S-L family lipolytic protein [Streptomyces mobaraensis NBRC 13819 = DSM 40847]KAB7849905.1 SGNH/GDSL hydrolase family protein [Streptomyces mobaraensis]QTT73986.1 SGNH/GDSL hydrolase family protein [Streptomyces mobaraensis NBRC 13819 = DSM 40847]
MTRPPLSRGAAGALLAALVAVVTLVSAAIFLGTAGGTTSGDEPQRRRTAAAPAAVSGWAGSWAAAPAAADPRAPAGLPGTSIRNVIHTSVGGTGARIHLSNLFGNRPLRLTHASLAVSAGPGTAAAVPGTMRRLSFGGQGAVSVPAGGDAVSDPVPLTVAPASDLLVTLYAAEPSGPVTLHPHARQVSWLARGDRTEAVDGAAYTVRTPYWRYVTGLDVWGTQAAGSVVAIGDSITDGVNSTMSANRRWTDHLAERLRTEPDAPRYGVLNEGISGNRILLGNRGGRERPNNPSALDRFDRDVLGRTGVRAVVVELGVNDILRRPQQLDARRIVDGLRRLVARAHTRGLVVVGSTLTPFGGHLGVVPARQEPVRLAVNAEIRAGRVFDSVVDFDRVLRDPAAPQRLLPAYDSGDRLHPNDLGYQRMAEAVDLGALVGRPVDAAL